MEIITRRQRMFSIARKMRRENKTVGFIPTMGALHEGHLYLIKHAQQTCDAVVVSVFVNPTQFNNQKDFDKYPRDLTADAAILADMKIDYLFAPDPLEIYPPNFSTFVYVENLTDTLEGAARPGHFRGVATVVTILLNTVRPEFAFFGEKDAQQLAVIKRLSSDLGFETEITGLPTQREKTGLAMSSRNERLSENDRNRAAVIYASLRAARDSFEKGQRNASNLTQIVQNGISTESDFRIDYVAVVDEINFQPIETIGDSGALICVAVFVDEIRLIDNIRLS